MSLENSFRTVFKNSISGNVINYLQPLQEEHLLMLQPDDFIIVRTCSNFKILQRDVLRNGREEAFLL